MSRFLAPHHAAAAHLVLSALVLLWNLYVASRTAQLRAAPRGIAFLSAMAGLLLLPALAVFLVSGSELTGRALVSVAWIWPATVGLVALQAILVVVRGLAASPIGIAIAAYDTLIALAAGARYAMSLGLTVGTPLVALVAAERGAVALSAEPLSPLAPWLLYLPILAPSTAGRRGLELVLRTMVAVLAAVWGTLVALDAPAAARAVGSYARYAGERMQERPDSDFVIGLKVFPTLSPGAPSSAIQGDLALADSIGAGVLSIYVAPSGATLAALETLARELDLARGDKRLIVALDLAHHAVPPEERSRFLSARVADVERITRVLRPDYIVPVVDPNGAAARQLGELPAQEWSAYLRDAASAVHRARPATRVMAHIGGFGARDSALYTWAAGAGSPINAVGLTLRPWLAGAEALDTRMRRADSWLRATRSTKEHWVLEAAGLPLTHGDESQARAIWATLAWATSRAVVKGLIVFEAGEYDAPLGLRTPSGRLRPAATMVRAAIRELGG